MAFPHPHRLPGGQGPSQTVRGAGAHRRSAVLSVVETLLLLVVLGIGAGQLVGSLLVTGIHQLLELVALGSGG